MLSLCKLSVVYADSATWNLNPATNDWNTAANWTPATIPNGPSDTATFGASNTTSISTVGNIDLASLVFSAGAPSYTITADPRHTMSFWDEGVRNDSGEQQTFTGGFSFNGDSSAGDNVTYDGAHASFNDNATAGSASFDDPVANFFDNASAAEGVFTNGSINFHNDSTAGDGTFTMDKGIIALYDEASAGNANFTDSAHGISFDMWGGTLGSATLTVNGTTAFQSNTIARFQFSATGDHATLIANGGKFPGVSDTGVILFENGATAAEATLIINPAPVAGNYGGSLEFAGGASAGNSSITVNGAAVTGDAAEGVVTFFGGSNTTAANATIVATGGSNGGRGGLVQFLPDAQGDTCRIELFGNSQLDVRSDLRIGSLEGEGTVTLGGHALIIGSNNLSTTFSGLIQDGNGAGSISKIGTGTLTLSSANTYSGNTTISSGILLLSNVSGSGTGSGAVTVNAGTLGGSGIIGGGAVTVGTDTGVQAFLAPSKEAKKPATLTIQSALTLQPDATYTCTFKARTNQTRADLVIANGVTIKGATIKLKGKTLGPLTPGTVLTLISDTSGAPINGTFSNLADGAIVTINGNNFQASYTGGDGNDLTLTVVP